MNTINTQQKGMELSEKAKQWLKAHKYDRKATHIKEYSGRLEFAVKSNHIGRYELHTVILNNGWWDMHEVPRMALKELY